MKLFLGYSKCSTCRKAKKWLLEKGVEFIDRDIKEENPSAEECKQWHQLSKLPLKKFFNTSGNVYKEMKLKDKLADMSEEQMYILLSSNGMLVKRPILVMEDKVLLGFKEEIWKEII